MPQEYISDSVLRTASDESTLSPVVGQIPALAIEAAMTDADSLVTCIEQHCKDMIYVQHIKKFPVRVIGECHHRQNSV